MFFNSYKMLFFFSMIFGTLISISSFSWISMWMGLEINLLSIIPLMMNSKNLFYSETTMKYFLIQALASAMFLFSSIFFYFLINSNELFHNFFFMIISLSMLLKMGSAPLHFWVAPIIEGLKWPIIFFILTWQKIAPMMIFSYFLNFYFLFLIVIFSVIFGSLGGLNQTSLRKLMAFSSINHLGWMMISMIYSENLWMNYFIFYTFLNLNIILMFYKFKLLNINQTFNLNKINFYLNLILFSILLSLGGLPPFLGFFPKWTVIETLSFKNNFFMLIIILFFTLVTLFFYLRITFNSLLMFYNKMKWNNFYFSFKINKLILLISFFSLSGLIFINLFYIYF